MQLQKAVVLGTNIRSLPSQKKISTFYKKKLLYIKNIQWDHLKKKVALKEQFKIYRKRTYDVNKKVENMKKIQMLEETPRRQHHSGEPEKKTTYLH